jgi:hypothetical protein
MIFNGAILALLPLAFAQYVIPAADGSDGWNDAFQKAKGVYQ